MLILAKPMASAKRRSAAPSSTSNPGCWPRNACIYRARKPCIRRRPPLTSCCWMRPKCPCERPKKSVGPARARRNGTRKKRRFSADKRTGTIIATAFCEGKKADFALFKTSRIGVSLRTLCLKDGCNPTPTPKTKNSSGFQSSAAPKDGCNPPPSVPALSQ
jgi:hypothetical protein